MTPFRLLPPFLGLLLAFALSSCSTDSSSPKPKGDYKYEFVYGRSVILRGRMAQAPESAPEAVKRAVAAGNRLQGKPYIYGGGHRRHEDVGYDCSGTASYVLRNAGLMTGTGTSGSFLTYGKPGPGKWITIYAKRGHVFTVIGGLRLDTGYNGQGEGPRWNTKSRPTKGYIMRHPPGL